MGLVANVPLVVLLISDLVEFHSVWKFWVISRHLKNAIFSIKSCFWSIFMKCFKNVLF